MKIMKFMSAQTKVILDDKKTRLLLFLPLVFRKTSDMEIKLLGKIKCIIN